MLRSIRIPIAGVLFIIALVLAGCENSENFRKGLQLKNTSDYKNAITQFQDFLKIYPDSAYKTRVQEEIADCYFLWAQNEKQLKHWDKGVELLQIILDTYPDTSVAEKIEEVLPEFLMEWSSQLAYEGKFIDSLGVLKRLILNFPASSPAQEGRELRKKIGIIAFNSDNNIYVMNADGSKLRKIATSAIAPTISPDGTKIAYIKIQKPGDKTGFLYLSNIDGRKAKQLLDNPVAADPNFSPDGTNILITKGDAFQTVDLSGRTINAYFGIKDFDTIGSFSPTGKQVVAFLKNPKDAISRLCVTENFEEYIELLNTKDAVIRDAAWSQDNLRIVYVTPNGLHTVSPEGENQMDFILSNTIDNMDIQSVDIAPTGSNIILIGKKQADPSYKLYYVTLNKDVFPLEYQASKDGELPLPDAGRVSWGYGYLRY